MHSVVLILLLLHLGTSVTCSRSTDAWDNSLLLTSVLHRHGDRAPQVLLPLSRFNNESFWPNGLEQLTEIGKAQTYRLGKFLRKRYGHLVGDRSNVKEIKVQSSSVDRCLMSVYQALAGFYSNSTEEHDLDLPFVRWQPTPVHTKASGTDEVLALDRPCNKLNEELDKVLNSQEVKQINADYAHFFGMVERHTGMYLGENKYSNVWLVTDALHCQYFNFGVLPHWTKQVYENCNNNPTIQCKDKTVWDILLEMNDYKFYISYSTSTLHEFSGGPFLVEVASIFSKYMEGSNVAPFNVFSAHDTTVSAVLNALGVFDMKQPQYTAAVMIELHKIQGTADFEVRVFYRPITDSNTVIPKQMPGCPSPCMLNDFVKMVEKYKISDWDKECSATAQAIENSHFLEAMQNWIDKN